MSEIPQLDQFVDQQLKSGKYQSYEAMVQGGLRLLQEREQELDAVAVAVGPAVEDFLRGGRGEDIDMDAFPGHGANRATSSSGLRQHARSALPCPRKS